MNRISRYPLFLLLHFCFASLDITLVPKYTPTIVAAYPHHRDYFTQGLTYHHNHLYESTGLYGQSKLIRYQLHTIAPEEKRLHKRLFAEGIASNQTTLYQLSWREGILLAHSADTTTPSLQINQGWGLCFDGAYFIQSDGSNRLYYRKQDMTPAFHIDVHYHNHPVGYLNDLAFYQGYILANIWFQDIIAVIMPHDGQIIGIIDLHILRTLSPDITDHDVLNGICTMPNGDLLVTGKNWPYFYQIKIDLAQRPTTLLSIV